jgi:hypothetical protein
MANTINSQGPVVEISAMDSDWTGEQRSLQSIQFNPGDTNDILVVKQGDASGPVIFQTKADSASDEVIKYFHKIGLQPFIDYSACTLSAGHKVIVIYGGRE